MNLEELTLSMPKKKQKFMNQEIVDIINDVEERGDFDGEYEKDVVSFSSILLDGRYKVTDYVKAVEFCAYYLNGNEQADSYMKTFPEKVKRRVMEGKSQYATGAPAMYFKNDLVQKILAQAQLPVRMYHHHKKHAAIDKLFSLMTSATTTDRIQMESADKLLGHLAEPEAQKVELEIGLKKDEGAAALEAKLMEVATLQRDAFIAGHDVKSLQKIAFTEDEEEFIDVETSPTNGSADGPKPSAEG